MRATSFGGIICLHLVLKEIFGKQERECMFFRNVRNTPTSEICKRKGSIKILNCSDSLISVTLCYKFVSYRNGKRQAIKLSLSLCMPPGITPLRPLISPETDLFSDMDKRFIYAHIKIEEQIVFA
jgi:hypothetical protein